MAPTTPPLYLFLRVRREVRHTQAAAAYQRPTPNYQLPPQRPYSHTEFPTRTESYCRGCAHGDIISTGLTGRTGRRRGEGSGGGAGRSSCAPKSSTADGASEPPSVESELRHTVRPTPPHPASSSVQPPGGRTGYTDPGTQSGSASVFSTHSAGVAPAFPDPITPPTMAQVVSTSPPTCAVVQKAFS